MIYEIALLAVHKERIEMFRRSSNVPMMPMRAKLLGSRH